MLDVVLRVFRGDGTSHEERVYTVPVVEGMVVLDAIHYIQHQHDSDLAVRWNCKAGRCGSCSAEINGVPRLLCTARVDALMAEGDIRIGPMRAFPLIKDLVTDVSYNYAVAKQIPPFTPVDEPTPWRMYAEDVERLQEFHRCIECFLCQNVCHILRDHASPFAGPRVLVKIAALEMHPKDTLDRSAFLKDAARVGMCNITKCCTEVCPEDIHITDNAIIPLKERVADRYYDPIQWVLRKVTGRS
ncbi:MAG: succinate dehydrogenase/fumarate reductase iron-sulfur subunit [Chloroflexi bacterium]|nr:succinate dehydrogenase/fumarate reductase iron-sulfur subunit [Chloroflexota bacterium]MBI4507963.1 succinate dehydrogenase/fumarate reductase iron-sulfur subunit [Chloroflexota bacterium]